MFNFAKLEALQEEIESTTPDDGAESKVDDLDVSSDVKEEIKDIIEEAVSEVVETVEEGESAAGEVEDTTTQLDEVTEQTENLILLYRVIKQHGISQPILELMDSNGSFRKACKSHNYSVSFESLSVTPSFGLEQQVALETIGETFRSGLETIKKLIAKIITFIKKAAASFISMFKDKTKLVKALNDKLQKVTKSDNVNFKVSMTGEEFKKEAETAAEDAPKLEATLTKTMQDYISSPPTTDDEYNALLSKIFSSKTYDIKEGRLVTKKNTSSTTNEYGPDKFKLSDAKDGGKHMVTYVTDLGNSNEQSKTLVKGLDQFITDIKSNLDKLSAESLILLEAAAEPANSHVKSAETSAKAFDKDHNQALLKYAQKLISFISSSYVKIKFADSKRLISTFITVARAYVYGGKSDKA
jgi:hypothetical protein